MMESEALKPSLPILPHPLTQVAAPLQPRQVAPKCELFRSSHVLESIRGGD